MNTNVFSNQITRASFISHLTGDPGTLSDVNGTLSGLRSDMVSLNFPWRRVPIVPLNSVWRCESRGPKFASRLLDLNLRSFLSSLSLHLASCSLAYAVRPKSGPGPGKLALSPKCSLRDSKYF